MVSGLYETIKNIINNHWLNDLIKKTSYKLDGGEERLIGLPLFSAHGREIQLEPEKIINEMAKSNRKIDFVL